KQIERSSWVDMRHASSSSNYPVIYRFFEDASYADALAAGQVWLSTLEKCRTYDDPLQGDPGEGSMLYKTGTVINRGLAKPTTLEIAQRAGIRIHPSCSNFTVDSSSYKRLDD